MSEHPFVKIVPMPELKHRIPLAYHCVCIITGILSISTQVAGVFVT